MNLKEAIHKTQNICSKQEKCIYDIKVKLKEWKVSEDDQEKIISLLKKEKYIDESRYALSFVHDKFHINKWGKIKLKYHLQQKGISKSDIEDAVKSIHQEVYLDVLKQLLKNKQKSINKNDYRTQYKKLLSFAYNRGFSYDESNEVIKEILKISR